MDRRNVLKLGAVAGLGGLGGAGCATVGDGSLGTAPPPILPDLEAFLARLDRGMAAIATGNPLKDLLPKSQVAATPRPEDLLIKKSLRSLLIAGSFRDLNEAERAHPAVQARIQGSMHEMDEAVFGMTHVLEGFTPSERARIREAIQADPDIGMRVAEALDTDAATADVSLQRRAHLRTIASQLSWRLKNQPIETAIDEYVGKVKRLSARNGYSEETQRRLAARATTSLLLAQAQPGAAQAQPGASGPVGAPAPPAGEAQPVYAPPAFVYAPGAEPYSTSNSNSPAAQAPRGGTAITVGAILLGLGVVVGVIGVVVAAGGGISGGVAGAFVLTQGALLLLGGLITLIVGLVLRARST